MHCGAQSSEHVPVFVYETDTCPPFVEPAQICHDSDSNDADDEASTDDEKKEEESDDLDDENSTDEEEDINDLKGFPRITQD